MVKRLQRISLYCSTIEIRGKEENTQPCHQTLHGIRQQLLKKQPNRKYQNIREISKIMFPGCKSRNKRTASDEITADSVHGGAKIDTDSFVAIYLRWSNALDQTSSWCRFMLDIFSLHRLGPSQFFFCLSSTAEGSLACSQPRTAELTKPKAEAEKAEL